MKRALFIAFCMASIGLPSSAHDPGACEVFTSDASDQIALYNKALSDQRAGKITLAQAQEKYDAYAAALNDLLFYADLQDCAHLMERLEAELATTKRPEK
jgi:hypothetical protein